jgi:pimeloyl-ACP methyl ester carboxylesterase
MVWTFQILVKLNVNSDIGPVVSKKGLERISAYINLPSPKFKSFNDAKEYCRKQYQTFGIGESDLEMFTRHSTVDLGTHLEFNYDPEIAHSLRNVSNISLFTLIIQLKPVTSDIILWSLWDKITIPVMVIRGKESDLLTTETIKEMMTRGPGISKLVEIENVGHAPLLNSPFILQEIKDFLDPTKEK